MFFIKLTLLKIKRMLRFLPGVLAGALALCFIMGIFAFGADKFIYKENTVVKQQVGVVRPEEDKYIDLALNLLKNIKSVETICDFSYVDNEEAALEMLENGELDAAVILPYHFIQDIVHGKNTPAKVIMPENSGLYAKVFKDLADNGIGMLADVQAAVQGAYYAVDDKDSLLLEEKNQDFNMVYFDIFLPREELFRERQVSASDVLSLSKYYGIMAVIVIMLLCGMCLGFTIGGENKAFAEAVKRKGMGRAVLFAANNITVIVFYIMLTAVVMGGVYAAGTDMRFDIGAIALAVILISALVCGIYTVFSPWAGALILFVITLVSAFVGGAVLPEAFLPDSVAHFTCYSPVYVLFDCLSNIFTKNFVFGSWAVYFITLVGIYAVTFLVQIYREVADV